MATLTYTLPTTGKPDFTQDPLIVAAFTAILAWAAGTISGTNIVEGGLEGRNCGSEIPKVTGTYVETTHATGAEFTPSATRPSVINFLAKCKAGVATALTIKVGGVGAAGVELKDATSEYSLSVNGVFVPAGTAVKLEGEFEGNAICRTLTL